MKLLKLENHKEIYNNDILMKIVSAAMFNPTYGRLKSAAEGIYSKEQGRMYVAKEEDYIGFVGVKRTDNFKVEIMHIAVEETLRNKGIGRQLVEFVIEMERVKEIHAETDNDGVGFYKKLGFIITEEIDKYTNIIRYVCVLKC